MTEHRDDGRLDVPVERLAGARGQRRRATIAFLSIAAVVGGAFGLARLADDRTVPAGAASHAPLAALGGASPGEASAGPSGTPHRSTAPRVERLLDIPDRALAGAPKLVLIEEDGLDIRILQWMPGAGLRHIRVVPGAVEADRQAVVPVLAPRGDRMLVLSFGTNTPDDAFAGSGDRARLLDRAGRVLWTGDDLAARSGAVWSPDGRLVVVAGNERRWHLVSMAADGTAHDRVVRLPREVFLPSPTPIGSMSIPRNDPRTVPLGFSADGRWAYGGIVSPELGILIGEFRVAVAGATGAGATVGGAAVERVPDLAFGRKDALLPQPGTLGGRLVDPASGRIANWRVNADTTGGPPSLEIRNADNGLAFIVDDATPLGSGWDGDGGLFVLAADSLLFANQVTLGRIESDGSVDPPILVTGPVSGAALLGVRDGYAAIALTVTRPSAATQIVLVDLVDAARITALAVPTEATGALIGVELAP